MRDNDSATFEEVADMAQRFESSYGEAHNFTVEAERHGIWGDVLVTIRSRTTGMIRRQTNGYAETFEALDALQRVPVLPTKHAHRLVA